MISSGISDKSVSRKVNWKFVLVGGAVRANPT